MKHVVGAAIAADDVAALIDSGSPGKGGAGEINRAELAPAPQIAMVHTGGGIPCDRPPRR